MPPPLTSVELFVKSQLVKVKEEEEGDFEEGPGGGGHHKSYTATSDKLRRFIQVS